GGVEIGEGQIGQTQLQISLGDFGPVGAVLRRSPDHFPEGGRRQEPFSLAIEELALKQLQIEILAVQLQSCLAVCQRQIRLAQLPVIGSAFQQGCLLAAQRRGTNGLGEVGSCYLWLALPLEKLCALGEHSISSVCRCNTDRFIEIGESQFSLAL